MSDSGGSRRRTLVGLDASSTRKNGTLQIVLGFLALIFGIAASAGDVVGSGAGKGSAGCGVVFFLGGVISQLAGAKRDLRWTKAALLSGVINLALSIFFFSTSVVSINQILFIYESTSTPKPTPEPLPPISNITAQLIFLSLVASACYGQLFTTLWTVFITSKALYYRNRSKSDDKQQLVPPGNEPAMQAPLKKVILGYGVYLVITTAGSTIASIIILYKAYTTEPFPYDPKSQITGLPLWCVLFFALSGYLALRIWQYGRHAEIIPFFIIHICQMVLCALEIAASALTMNETPDFFAAHVTIIACASLQLFMALIVVCACLVYFKRDRQGRIHAGQEPTNAG